MERDGGMIHLAGIQRPSSCSTARRAGSVWCFSGCLSRFGDVVCANVVKHPTCSSTRFLSVWSVIFASSKARTQRRPGARR